jgi:hypothetical protein
MGPWSVAINIRTLSFEENVGNRNQDRCYKRFLLMCATRLQIQVTSRGCYHALEAPDVSSRPFDTGLLLPRGLHISAFRWQTFILSFTRKLDMTAYFHILSNSSVIIHPTIRRGTGRDADSVSWEETNTVLITV